jgi:hypothetical protein
MRPGSGEVTRFQVQRASIGQCDNGGRGVRERVPELVVLQCELLDDAPAVHAARQHGRHHDDAGLE